MTQKTFSTNLRRASERVAAGVAAIALTACLLVATDVKAANAQSVRFGQSITVKFEHDAFISSEGTEQVYRTLKSAARQVCRTSDGVGTLQQRVVSQKCYADTLADVVRKVGSPQLSALHQASIAARVG